MERENTMENNAFLLIAPTTTMENRHARGKLNRKFLVQENPPGNVVKGGDDGREQSGEKHTRQTTVEKEPRNIKR